MNSWKTIPIPKKPAPNILINSIFLSFVYFLEIGWHITFFLRFYEVQTCIIYLDSSVNLLLFVFTHPILYFLVQNDLLREDLRYYPKQLFRKVFIFTENKVLPWSLLNNENDSHLNMNSNLFKEYEQSAHNTDYSFKLKWQ